MARRNLLWDILRLPSSRRATLGLMSFSHYDKDEALSSHHTHCCIGARCATHCATAIAIVAIVAVVSYLYVFLLSNYVDAVVLVNMDHFAPKAV